MNTRHLALDYLRKAKARLRALQNRTSLRRMRPSKLCSGCKRWWSFMSAWYKTTKLCNFAGRRLPRLSPPEDLPRVPPQSRLPRPGSSTYLIYSKGSTT